jgi:group I intron endonuclease
MGFVGVYQIRNLTTGNVYVGSSVNVMSRLRSHLRVLEIGKHFNRYLQNAFDKYGEEDFVFELLICCPRDEMRRREKSFIDATAGCHYNIREIDPDSSLGIHLSKETRARISEGQRRRTGVRHWKLSDEAKHNIGAGATGHVVSDEARRKLRNARLGSHPTAETRKKLSEAHKGNHPSDETRKRLSESTTHYWELVQAKA